jgi:membrane-bound lytic murein transglycosylase F
MSIRISTLILIPVIISVIAVTPLSVKSHSGSDNTSATNGQNVMIRAANPPYHGVIRQVANEYKLDYRLIFSIIKQESRFQNDAVSEQGATGLMQVMPAMDSDTSDVISPDLNVPEDNIRAGISYFAQMMDLFKNTSPDDQIQLALAAYNAGPARIYDAMELAAYIGENPLQWAPVRNALPMLSMRYYSLHQSVWKDGKPKSGYFGDWRQTVSYVENVMKYYNEYQSQFKRHTLSAKISQ